MDAQDGDIDSRVQQIIVGLAAEQGYGGPAPDDDRPLKELGFDSLLTVELVAQLENELGVEIPDESLTPAAFATLGSTLAVVRSLR